MTELLNKIDNNYLQLTLSLLEGREKKIVQLHLGFETGRSHSFDEISNVMNITRQRAFQIYHAGIERLKNILTA